jgi:hypothetical protein
MARKTQVPSYRLHKQSGQAVVTLRDIFSGRRRDVLLGAHGTPASRGEYVRVLAEWEAAGRRLTVPALAPANITVNEVALSFLDRRAITLPRRRRCSPSAPTRLGIGSGPAQVGIDSFLG